jgi:hypothetical protein
MRSLVRLRFASMMSSYGGGARLTARGLELGAGKRSGVGRLMWDATAGCWSSSLKFIDAQRSNRQSTGLWRESTSRRRVPIQNILKLRSRSETGIFHGEAGEALENFPVAREPNSHHAASGFAILRAMFFPRRCVVSNPARTRKF